MALVTALFASICIATADLPQDAPADAVAPCIDRQVFVNRTWTGPEGMEECDTLAFHKRAAAITNGLAEYADYYCETDPHGDRFPLHKDARPIDIELRPARPEAQALPTRPAPARFTF